MHIKSNQFEDDTMSADILLFFLIVLSKLMIFNGTIDRTGIWSIPLIASAAGTVLILVFWAGLLPKKVRFPLFIILDCVVTFIIIADLLFFRYFSDVLSMPLLAQASVVSSVKSSIVSLFHASDLIFIADLPLLPFISARVGRFNKNTKYVLGKESSAPCQSLS